MYLLRVWKGAKTGGRKVVSEGATYTCAGCAGVGVGKTLGRDSGECIDRLDRVHLLLKKKVTFA